MRGYYRRLSSLDYGSVKDRDMFRGFAKRYKRECIKRDRAMGRKSRLLAELDPPLVRRVCKAFAES